MTLLFYFLLKELFAKSRFSQNQSTLLVKKMGKKQLFSRKERAQTVTLSNLKFSLRQIAKMMKVNSCGQCN